MKNKLEPVGTYILVEIIDENKGLSIIIPDAIKDQIRHGRGTVVAIGQDVEKVKVGQNIVFKEYAPFDVEWEGKKYLVIEEVDVLLTFDSKS